MKPHEETRLKISLASAFAWVAFFCVVILIAGCSDPEVDETGDAEQSSPAVAPARAPEDVVKEFLLATMVGDGKAVADNILPNKDAHLLSTHGAIPDQMRQQIEDQVNSAVVTEFVTGQTIYLAGGRQLVVTAEMSNSSNKVVVVSLGGQPMPSPLYLRLIDGYSWKVDATPLIEARKAARAAR